MFKKFSVPVFLIILICTFFLIYKGINGNSAQISNKIKAPKNDFVEIKSISFDEYLTKNNILKNKELGSVYEAIASKSFEIKEIDKAINYCEKNQLFGFSGFLKEQIGNKSNLSNDFLNAGEAYFRAVAVSENEQEQALFLDLSKKMFDKSIEINPENLKATNNLAVYYIERFNGNPEYTMKAVGLLRKSLSVDSNNVDATYILGKLAIESNQLEKAIQRFKKLISLQPSNASHYYQLSDIYGRLDEKDKAKEYLELAKNIQKANP